MPGKWRMDYLRLGSRYASKHAQNREQPGTRSHFNSVIRKVSPKRWKNCGGIRLKSKNLTFLVLRWAGEEQIRGCLTDQGTLELTRKRLKKKNMKENVENR